MRTGRTLAELGLISLKRRAVVAGFIEQPTTRKDFVLAADFSSNHQVRGTVIRASLGVNSSAVGLRNEDVAIGIEYLTGKSGLPAAFLTASPKRKVRSILVSVESFQRNPGRLCRTSKKLHDSSERIAAIEARTAFLRYFHTGDGFSGHAIPIDPAAERIVEWNTVFKHESAA